MKKSLKIISLSFMAFMLTTSGLPVLSVAAVEESAFNTIEIDMQKVCESWVHYPSETLGSAYDADWTYNTTEGFLNTTQNVGWTGFYNPDAMNFTTGALEFNMKSLNPDSSGFVWGLQVGGTEDDPVYSFYAYEEYQYSKKWTIAYIDEWHPSWSAMEHQGPLYRGVIDAADQLYYYGQSRESVGFATGTVLASGTLSDELYKAFHEITIDIQKNSVSVYINDSLLKTVSATAQAGSYGPFAVSNPDAYFSNKSAVPSYTDVAIVNAKFEYRNNKNESVYSESVGHTISVVDLSNADGTEIGKYIWTVTKDGKTIYTGTEAYTEYTKSSGTYVTTLTVTDITGTVTDTYTATLTVKPSDPVEESSALESSQPEESSYESSAPVEESSSIESSAIEEASEASTPETSQGEEQSIPESSQSSEGVQTGDTNNVGFVAVIFFGVAVALAVAVALVLKKREN